MTAPLRRTGKTGVIAGGDKEKPRLLTGAELGRGEMAYGLAACQCASRFASMGADASKVAS
jgi:hypothetical protein